MDTEGLTLDPKIRDWVLLPIVFIMILVGVGRSYARMLMASENPADAEIVRHQNLLGRSGRLRTNGRYLPPSAFAMRKHFLTAKEKGALRQKIEGGPPNPMANPSGMMDMMKGNMTMMVPNMVMMAWINYFFSGFVLVKIPFGLTEGFKGMLQRGVDLKTLDPSYVSSLSWYFLVMFGLRGFFSLILGDNAVLDDARMMQAQMGMGAGMGAQQQMQFDASKAYKAEKENLMIVNHVWAVADAERKLLGLPIAAPGAAPVLAQAAASAVPSTRSGKPAGLRQRKGKK